MADSTGPLTPGDRWRPSADVLNGYQDAADYVRDLKAGGGALPVRGDSRQVVVVTVKNTSGQDCARFGVLGIDSPIFLPADNKDVFCNRVSFNCIKPEIHRHASRFVVLLQPAAQDDLVQACLVGVVPVRLKLAHQWHQFAHIQEGDPTCLVSDYVGYPIVWKDDEENKDENGNRWALVKIGGQADGMGIWRNDGVLSVGPHQCFRAIGAIQDADRPAAWTGLLPTDRFGHEYMVNGSQPVGTGQYGICQLAERVFVNYVGSASPEVGDDFGPAPGQGALARNYPPICRCLGSVDPGNHLMIAIMFRQPQRFKLHEPLYECSSADAQIMGRSGLTYSTCADYLPSTISDTLGAVAQSPMAMRDSKTGKLFIPAGKCLNARYAHNPGSFWEVLDLSECSCESSSSSFSRSASSSSSESSHSDSGSFSVSASASTSSSDSDSQSQSGSGSDEQNSSSGSESQSGSGSASASGSDGSGGSTGDASESGSQGSGSQPSGSEPSGSQGSGSGGGFTGAIDLVNAVWCDDNKIKYSTLTLSFQNGLLMGVG